VAKEMDTKSTRKFKAKSIVEKHSIKRVSELMESYNEINSLKRIKIFHQIKVYFHNLI
tara:strand:+ start:343 stop:516 length:174 start_codon:yes stop_codon:yes gene_type:complete